jgi:hypothetical protein
MTIWKCERLRVVCGVGSCNWSSDEVSRKLCSDYTAIEDWCRGRESSLLFDSSASETANQDDYTKVKSGLEESRPWVGTKVGDEPECSRNSEWEILMEFWRMPRPSLFACSLIVNINGSS